MGISFVIGLVISLWSANGGIKALFDALNVVYEEKEERSFIKLNAVSLRGLRRDPAPRCLPLRDRRFADSHRVRNELYQARTAVRVRATGLARQRGREAGEPVGAPPTCQAFAS
jgi:hypothetical protein